MHRKRWSCGSVVSSTPRSTTSYADMRRQCTSPRGGTVSATALWFLAAASAWAASNLSIDDIVSRSVAAVQANWKAAPEFGFREHDVITKGGTRRVRTYQVWMLEGSTYNKLIAEDCRPLSASEAFREEEKLQQEVQVRRSESVTARKKRIGQYDSERRQD